MRIVSHMLAINEELDVMKKGECEQSHMGLHWQHFAQENGKSERKIQYPLFVRRWSNQIAHTLLILT